MIANILKYNLLVSLFLCGYQIAAGNTNLEEKRKVIQKSFDASPNVLLQISNEFGNVHVESWDKNQIEVEVEIIARGRNEEKAQKTLDKISIDISKSSSEISFETDVHELNVGVGSESFEINYRIKMNSKNPIEFENRFGDMYLPFRTGETTVALHYGKLKFDGSTGYFQFELSFGGAEIGDLSEAKMEIQYSEVILGKVIDLDIEQKFSELDVESIENLQMEAKYGDMEIGSLDRGEVEAHYSGFKVSLLRGYLVFEGNYVSTFEIRELSKNFTLVDLSGQYSSYKIGLASGLSADIEAEFSYASLNYADIPIDFYYKDFEGNKKEYKGRINGGNSNRKIIVNSSYGDLRLRQ